MDTLQFLSDIEQIVFASRLMLIYLKCWITVHSFEQHVLPQSLLPIAQDLQLPCVSATDTV